MTIITITLVYCQLFKPIRPITNPLMIQDLIRASASVNHGNLSAKCFQVSTWCPPWRSASAWPSSTSTPAAQSFVFPSSPPPPCRQCQQHHHNWIIIIKRLQKLNLWEKFFWFSICLLQLAIVVCVVEVSGVQKTTDGKIFGMLADQPEIQWYQKVVLLKNVKDAEASDHHLSRLL